jgi:hypothetical protein
MSREGEQEEYERGYIEGERRAYLSVLRHVRSHFDHEGETKELNWLIERQEAVGVLRGLCAQFGDNDWPDNLYLYDVLTKHLGDHLEEDLEGWSRDEPAEGGFYWVKDYILADGAIRRFPVVCHVRVESGDDSVVLFTGDEMPHRLSEVVGGTWWGPLTAPAEVAADGANY